jgi:hypothetical protein
MVQARYGSTLKANKIPEELSQTVIAHIAADILAPFCHSKHNIAGKPNRLVPHNAILHKKATF